MSDDLRKSLQETLDEAEWAWLSPHHQRGAVILVSHELDLLVVAEKVARDSREDVQKWLKEGLLTRPTPAQAEAWTKTPHKKFLSLIVQPWVLAQELLLH